MSKIRNGGLDQYGAKPFEQQQFGTAGVEGVKIWQKHFGVFFSLHSVCITYACDVAWQVWSRYADHVKSVVFRLALLDVIYADVSDVSSRRGKITMTIRTYWHSYTMRAWKYITYRQCLVVRRACINLSSHQFAKRWATEWRLHR